MMTVTTRGAAIEVLGLPTATECGVRMAIRPMEGRQMGGRARHTFSRQPSALISLCAVTVPNPISSWRSLQESYPMRASVQIVRE